MGTMEMRTEHDTIPHWVYADPSGKEAFTKGTLRMDQTDMELAKEMYYEAMGWDKATGAPTMTTYRNLGLGKVSEALSRKGLLP
jgi:aldehyde:ferredoxin oxidoreductase